MTSPMGVRRRRAILGVVGLCALLAACGPTVQATAASFVGKWKSSKLATPLYLYDNGEWEIKNDEGGILQYGVWEYRDQGLVWSFKQGATVMHDVNKVQSVTDREFRLKEGADVTVFTRLD